MTTDETAGRAPSLAEELEALLGGDISAAEQSRRLFGAAVAQVRETDPELAEIMPALALPRRFDAEVIGALRGAPEDSAGSARMLGVLRQLAFVEAAGEGALRYHDSVREALREEARGGDSELRERLGAFFLERGRRRLLNREAQDALEDFTEAHELHHESSYTALWVGAGFIATQNYQAAIPLLKQATEEIPSREGYYWRGVAEAGADDIAASIDSFTLAFDQKRDERLLIVWDDNVPRPAQSDHDLVADILSWRGGGYRKQKQHDSAITDFSRAIELRPDGGNNYNGRGRAYYFQGDYAAALADFTRAIELRPDDGYNCLWRGAIEVQLYNRDRSGDLNIALSDLSRAIELQPNNGSNYRWLGRAHYAQGDYVTALSDLSRAIELQPDDGNSYHWRGRAYYARGDYPTALADFSRAIELRPDNDNNHGWRGRTYYEQSNFAAALADFTRAIELRPGNGYHYVWRGATIVRLHNQNSSGSLNAALVDFNSAIRLQPDNGRNYYWRGRAHHAQGDYAAALADFARAIELQPNDDSNYFWKGLSLLETEHLADAQEALHRAAELDDDDAHHQFWLGVVHLLLDNTTDGEQAIVQAEMINSREPKNSRRLRIAAKLAARRGEVASARDSYQEAVSICSLDDLGYELLYLRLLARLSPERADLAELHRWLAEQVEAKRGQLGV